VEVEEMVQDAFTRSNVIHVEAVAKPVNPRDDANTDLHGHEEVNMVDLENLVVESTQAVYEGCGVNHL